MINLGPNIRLIVLNYKKTEIHGHRGCRGYYPENTLPGFMHALKLPIDAIELDVVISKDNQVVVSHEHYMHHKKCLWPNLKPISKADEASLFLYDMDLATIKTFDCGLLAHPDYPLLKTCPAYKPLLNEVFETVISTSQSEGRAIPVFNIEIKSEPEFVGKYQPDYAQYTNLVLHEIERYHLEQQVIIQSFDKEILRAIRKFNPAIRLSLLIEDELNPMQHIDELGFLPQILASDYIYLNAQNTAQLQSFNINVFAFTVNKIDDIQSMLNMGVNAIISDYPDVVAKVINAYK